MKRIRMGLVLMALLVPGIAKAQVGVYAAFSAAKLNGGGTDWIYGPTFGAYYDAVHLPVVNLGLDVRGAVLGGSGNTQMKNGMTGPRAVLHLPVVPLKPYVEALVGAEYQQYIVGPITQSSTKAKYGLATGLDLTFFPRLDWRVVDYQVDGSSGAKGSKTISTGLVFRLPIP